MRLYLLYTVILHDPKDFVGDVDFLLFVTLLVLNLRSIAVQKGRSSRGRYTGVGTVLSPFSCTVIPVLACACCGAE